jgi:hypothetical protein
VEAVSDEVKTEQSVQRKIGCSDSGKADQ